MALYADGKGRYQKEYDVLWNKLVPRSGKSKTTKGELVRAIGRLAAEYYRNGNINWDQDFDSHVCFLENHLLKEIPRQTNIKKHAKLARDLKTIRNNGQSGRCRYSDAEDEYDRVTDSVVEWCNASQDKESKSIERRSPKKHVLSDLLEAASQGKNDLVEFMISESPELINRRGRKDDGIYYGETALLISLKNRQYEIAKFLLNKGADPNLKSTAGGALTCLLLAVGLWRHLPTLKLLLSKGANPNASDYSGEYPLMNALLWYKNGDSRKEVSLLMEYGADVDYAPKSSVSVRDYMSRSHGLPNSAKGLLGL